MSVLIINTREWPELDGQELGRELDLEITAVVTEIVNQQGGSPTLGVTLTIVRLDIMQTT